MGIEYPANCKVCKALCDNQGQLIVHCTMMHSTEELKEAYSRDELDETFNISERERDTPDPEELKGEEFGY